MSRSLCFTTFYFTLHSTSQMKLPTTAPALHISLVRPPSSFLFEKVEDCVGTFPRGEFCTVNVSRICCRSTTLSTDVVLYCYIQASAKHEIEAMGAAAKAMGAPHSRRASSRAAAPPAEAKSGNTATGRRRV